MLGYSASLALVLTLSAPIIPTDIGVDGVAFAQGTGQPGSGQPGSDQPGTGTPNQTSGTSNETTSGPGSPSVPGQQPGTQQTGTQPGQGTGGTTQQTGAGGTAQQAGGQQAGRGGAEVPGQPACYMPTANVTERQMYNLNRPSCFPGHLE
jgi:hypothetical protein